MSDRYGCNGGEYNSVHCNEHPKALLIEDYRAGDQICSECGLVVGDRVIDVSAEWRTFSKDNQGVDHCRVGGSENPLLEGGGLSTMIEAGGTGAAAFDEAGNAKYRQSRGSVSRSDRMLMRIIKEISNMGSRINATKSVIDRANNIFKMVHEGKRIKCNDAIAGACVYIACRQEGVPRTFKEICAVSRYSKKDIGRSFKLILQELETSVDVIQTDDFISRFCSNLGLLNEVERAATFIARKASDLNLVCGRSPISVTAAAIYMASQASETKCTAKEIADVAGVAHGAIRQSYKLMLPSAEELFPNNFNFFLPLHKLPRR